MKANGLNSFFPRCLFLIRVHFPTLMVFLTRIFAALLTIVTFNASAAKVNGLIFLSLLFLR